MNGNNPTTTAELRHGWCSPEDVRRQYWCNRRMQARYGSSTIPSFVDPIDPFGVMALRHAIIHKSACSLRQKPTSNRRGKVVGSELAQKRVIAWEHGRARRRVFIVAPEGWVP